MALRPLVGARVWAPLVPAFRQQAGLLALGTAGLGVASGLGVYGPTLLARAIDQDLPAGDLAGVRARAVAFAVAVGLGWVASYTSRLALEIAAQGALVRLKLQLFDHLVGHDVRLHDQVPSGSLVGRVQGDIEALRVLFVEVVLALPADLVLLGGVAVVLLAEAAPMAVPIGIVLPLYLLLFALFRWIAPPAFVRQRQRFSELAGITVELARTLPALRALGRHRWATERLERAAEHLRRVEVVSQLHPIWYFNGAVLLRVLATVGVLVWGGALVDRGQATVGALVLGLSYLRLLFQPLMRMSNQLATLERARASLVRIGDLLEDRPRVVDPPDPAPWPGLARALTFEDVGFSYVPGVPVLEGIDLVVPAGTRLGVVGASGSGKSTLVDLALRFRDPDQGRITVDGVDLKSMRRADLRSRSALVLQDVALLPGTVVENLGGDRVAARAALDALGADFDLDAPVVESALSRGQRQLLTFARALAADPELLVLDEATSAVDPDTEDLVAAALDRLMKGRTVIVVAHRLDTVRRCDRICVLAGGRVAELGTHDELLARSGLYASLLRLQEAA